MMIFIHSPTSTKLIKSVKEPYFIYILIFILSICLIANHHVFKKYKIIIKDTLRPTHNFRDIFLDYFHHYNCKCECILLLKSYFPHLSRECGSANYHATLVFRRSWKTGNTAVRFHKIYQTANTNLSSPYLSM